MIPRLSFMGTTKTRPGMTGIGSVDMTHEGDCAFDSPQTVGQTAVGTDAERVLVVVPRMNLMEAIKFGPRQCESCSRRT